MAKGWTKLTDERADRLIGLLRECHFVSTACAAVGINERTFRTWCQRGEEGDARWADFALKAREAQSCFEVALLNAIVGAVPDDWKAASWILQHRHPTRWGDHKAASAKLDAERAELVNMVVQALEKRGLGEMAEEIVSDIAGSGESEAAGIAGPANAAH